MTIIYNTETSEIVGRYEDGYEVDWVKQPLGELDQSLTHLCETGEPIDATNLLHLEFVTNPMPDYNSETQRIETSWQVIGETYAQTWQVIQLSEWEKWVNGWHETSFVARVVAPKALVFDDMGVKLCAWFMMNKLPIYEKDENTVCLYMNKVLPDHRQLAEAMAGHIEIQHLYPYLLNIASKEIHQMNDKSGACNIDQIANKKWLKDDNEMMQALTEGADGCGHCMPEHNNQ